MEGSIPDKMDRHILIHPSGGPPELVNDTSGPYDPMAYPLLFPSGENGWNINIRPPGWRQGREQRVTCREYYAYDICIRTEAA